MDVSFTISSQIIITEAKSRGISVEKVCSKVAKLSYNGNDEYLGNQFISKTSAVALEITNQKDLTKEILRKSGISVSEGRKFIRTQEGDAIEFAKQIGWPVVLKPTNSSHGNCVFADIKNKADFVKAWRKIGQKFSTILVEKYFAGGTEYRIIATKEKILAITNRVPANIIGDGMHTITELIQIKNCDPRRGDDSYLDHSKPLVKIIIDDVVMQTLEKQNLNLESIPPQGKQIFLRENSNLSTGGDSIDFTEKVHPSVKKIAIDAIKAIPGLAYGGLDFLSKDIMKEQGPGDYIIVEINASPGIFMHHFPYEGTPRNVAREIIDIAFPETKKADE